MTAPLQFVAHPGAGRGAFARAWPAMGAALAAAGLDNEVLLTTRAFEAADLARHAAQDGARLVVAVGGDGTLHEVVNGLLTADLPPDAIPALGLVPAGRGSDYARGLHLPRDAAMIVPVSPPTWTATQRRPLVDAGEATFRPAALVAGRPTPPSPLPSEPTSARAGRRAAVLHQRRRDRLQPVRRAADLPVPGPVGAVPLHGGRPADDHRLA